MANSADPDQLASSDTVCKGSIYPGSAGLGLEKKMLSFYISAYIFLYHFTFYAHIS